MNFEKMNRDQLVEHIQSNKGEFKMKNQIETFYAIKMVKSPFYLMVTDSGNFVWDDKENSLCFQTAEQAESFGEKYFTRFLGWEVVEVTSQFS